MNKKENRRDVLRRFVTLTAMVPAVATAVWAGQARAAGTTPKSDVQYQYTPSGNAKCGLCTSFIPGADPEGPGTCKIVAGPIPQNGWCELFSAR